MLDRLSGRRRDREEYGHRFLPGQKVVQHWPVLIYGGTPAADTSDRNLRIFGLVANGPYCSIVPHLYSWKSVNWVSGIEFIGTDRPGFWEQYGHHLRREPWKKERYA